MGSKINYKMEEITKNKTIFFSWEGELKEREGKMAWQSYKILVFTYYKFPISIFFHKINFLYSLSCNLKISLICLCIFLNLPSYSFLEVVLWSMSLAFPLLSSPPQLLPIFACSFSQKSSTALGNNPSSALLLASRPTSDQHTNIILVQRWHQFSSFLILLLYPLNY